MKALTWHGKRDVRVDTVPDPTIEQPTDAIIRVTSSGLCGSDLDLYEVLGPFLAEGDILGHEPMGVVEAVGPEVSNLTVGDRVVIPFNISCGHCFMCDRGLQSQCETTQNHEQGMGASLFGYTKLYGQVAGGQAELLRVPQAQAVRGDPPGRPATGLPTSFYRWTRPTPNACWTRSSARRTACAWCGCGRASSSSAPPPRRYRRRGLLVPAPEALSRAGWRTRRHPGG